MNGFTALPCALVGSWETGLSVKRASDGSKGANSESLQTQHPTAMCGSCQRGAPDQQMPLIHLRLVTNAQTNPDRNSTIIQAGAEFAVAAVCPAVPDFGKC